ncbi:MAG TPA: ATP-binding protein, partial [Miltoncostaeaceae bacterium]|nr:ATP-binding protein [Miltoncostaeaceae bacterium]
RARESIDDSLERLRRAATAATAPSADALCDALLATMAAAGSDDDTALLALRLDPTTPDPLEVTVPAEAVQLATLRHRLSRWLHEAGAGSAGEDLVLAGSEAAANCVEHAYRRRPVGEILMRARLDGGAVELEIRDTGRWRAAPAPGDRGRGLGMMRALMDDVAVRTDAAGTVVRMIRRLGRGPRRRGTPAAPVEGGPGRMEVSRHGDASGAAVLVRLTGEVDHASAPVLLAQMRREIAPGDELTVDLREVPFLDSAGTRLVGELLPRTGAARLRLVVRPGSTAHRAIELAGLGAAPRVELEARS